MKTLIFDLEKGNKDRALKEASRLFLRAGAQVVSSEVDPKLGRRAGTTFRSVHFTFADGQQVTFAVKKTGDVFEVRLNGKPLPLRHQDDHTKAIAEIAERLDNGRAAFQRALARVRVPLPASIRVSRTTMYQKLVERRDSLVVAVQEAKNTLASLLPTVA